MVLILRHLVMPGIIIGSTIATLSLIIYATVGRPQRLRVVRVKDMQFVGHTYQELDRNKVSKIQLVSIIAFCTSLALIGFCVGIFLLFGELNFPREIYQSGNSDKVRAALKAGADVNDWDECGWTPLIHASVNNRDLQVIATLLDSGARINEGPGGKTALWFVIDSTSINHIEQAETIHFLLKRGANPNCYENREGFTALMLATQNKESEVIRLLLDAGANPKVKNIFKKTALDYADRSNGDYAILKPYFQES